MSEAGGFVPDIYKERFTRKLTTEELQQELAPHLSGEIPSRGLLERYRPQPQWYANPDLAFNARHDMAHSALLMVFGEQVMNREEQRLGRPLNKDAVRWSLATHDTQRTVDTVEAADIKEMALAEHGRRASAWVHDVFSPAHPDIPQATIDLIAKGNYFHGYRPLPEEALAIPEVVTVQELDHTDTLRGVFSKVPVPFTGKYLTVPEGLRDVALRRSFNHYDQRFRIPAAKLFYPYVNQLRMLSRVDLDKYRSDPVTAVFDTAEKVGLIKA